MDNAGNATLTFGQKLNTVTSSMMSVSMAINSLKSLVSIWTSEDTSTLEKVVTTFTTLGMAAGSVATMFSA
jgi:hypothetical protein